MLFIDQSCQKVWKTSSQILYDAVWFLFSFLLYFQTLTANDRGDPSRELTMALGPELRVKKVLHREFGVCDAPQTQPTPPMNFSPILRNPVDHVNATVGELLIYKVKDVSIYCCSC